MFDLPHREARARLAAGGPVYLSTNPIEFHGPHLALHNDRLVSEGIIHELHARLAVRHPDWPLLVIPDLGVGVEPCPGMGSRHNGFAVTREVVLEACRSLVELGAKRVVLMTFHGSPLHNLAIEAGVQYLESHGVRAAAPFNMVLREMLTLDPTRYAEAFATIEDPLEREEMMRELRFDFHAGFFETSVALHFAPDSVAPSYRELPPCPVVVRDYRFDYIARLSHTVGATLLASELTFVAVALGWARLRPFPGYTGRPSRASREAGAVFARAILDLYEPVVEEVLAGRAKSPTPVMAWTGKVSLGGRIGQVRLTVDEIQNTIST